MIVREMPNEQLLCIPQVAHALMAGEFCHHWGNQHFAKPAPFAPVMLAITQHDCGWYEWDEKPKLRPDGYPMDFLHDDDPVGKVELWRRGINRIFAQHPYAAILAGRHTSWLYEMMLELEDVDEELHMLIADFIADQQMLIEYVRYIFSDAPAFAESLTDEQIEANARLVQFGDAASLAVSIPWGAERTFPYCPLNAQGGTTSVHMQFDDQEITFDPWPYGVDQFDVTMGGWLLPQRTFDSKANYHRILGEANHYRHTWLVRPR